MNFTDELFLDLEMTYGLFLFGVYKLFKGIFSSDSGNFGIKKYHFW